MATKKDTTTEIVIPPLKRASMTLRIVGETPLYCNRMAAKAKQQLLVGGRKKTSTDKLAIKHNPLEEFRDSVERVADGPTALGLRVVAIKAAMATAALETAGITKTSAQRLLFMPGELTALYGTPQLKMDITRSADINKTPDVRTRAFLPAWGAEVVINYVVPQLSASSVATLLCNAGVLIGLGDFRQEKGKGAYGSFRVLGEGEEDPAWAALVTQHGRVPQEAALEAPVYADDDTAELMDYFFAETKRRAA